MKLSSDFKTIQYPQILQNNFSQLSPNFFILMCSWKSTKKTNLSDSHIMKYEETTSETSSHMWRKFELNSVDALDLAKGLLKKWFLLFFAKIINHSDKPVCVGLTVRNENVWFINNYNEPFQKSCLNLKSYPRRSLFKKNTDFCATLL